MEKYLLYYIIALLYYYISMKLSLWIILAHFSKHIFCGLCDTVYDYVQITKKVPAFLRICAVCNYCMLYEVIMIWNAFFSGHYSPFDCIQMCHIDSDVIARVTCSSSIQHFPWGFCSTNPCSEPHWITKITCWSFVQFIKNLVLLCFHNDVLPFDRVIKHCIDFANLLCFFKIKIDSIRKSIH